MEEEFRLEEERHHYFYYGQSAHAISSASCNQVNDTVNQGLSELSAMIPKPNRLVQSLTNNEPGTLNDSAGQVSTLPSRGQMHRQETERRVQRADITRAAGDSAAIVSRGDRRKTCGIVSGGNSVLPYNSVSSSSCSSLSLGLDSTEKTNGFETSEFSNTPVSEPKMRMTKISSIIEEDRMCGTVGEATATLTRPSSQFISKRQVAGPDHEALNGRKSRENVEEEDDEKKEVEDSHRRLPGYKRVGVPTPLVQAASLYSLNKTQPVVR
ncbi:unnamed protein product [Protopolystoma xenopodis]|uniref:Uncharacterized protein n=1 Tax=Protopolystoma xenopodis TaxID=117903 RepID=A0A3S5A606_9PLAT|nr:unnamed protein product [Protopolystoma xenopodis]